MKFWYHGVGGGIHVIEHLHERNVDKTPQVRVEGAEHVRGLPQDFHRIPNFDEASEQLE